MVKNATGGNKAKQCGRKFTSSGGGGGGGGSGASVRKVKEEGEMYGAITRLNGGKYCQVLCVDGVNRRCVIRKKFTSKRRGENMIAVGVWVMVGLPAWGGDGDILEIYSHTEKDQLKQQEKAGLFTAIQGVGELHGGGAETEVQFSERWRAEAVESESESESESEDRGPDRDLEMKFYVPEEEEDEDDETVVPKTVVPKTVVPKTVVHALAQPKLAAPIHAASLIDVNEL